MWLRSRPCSALNMAGCAIASLGASGPRRVGRGSTHHDPGDPTRSVAARSTHPDRSRSPDHPRRPVRRRPARRPTAAGDHRLLAFLAPEGVRVRHCRHRRDRVARCRRRAPRSSLATTLGLSAGDPSAPVPIVLGHGPGLGPLPDRNPTAATRQAHAVLTAGRVRARHCYRCHQSGTPDGLRRARKPIHLRYWPNVYRRFALMSWFRRSRMCPTRPSSGLGYRSQRRHPRLAGVIVGQHGVDGVGQNSDPVAHARHRPRPAARSPRTSGRSATRPPKPRTSVRQATHASFEDRLAEQPDPDGRGAHTRRTSPRSRFRLRRGRLPFGRSQGRQHTFDSRDREEGDPSDDDLNRAWRCGLSRRR